MGMMYQTGAFKETEKYWCHAFKGREEWLKGRGALRGVGGSDSAAALGVSPWKSNLALWKEKTGRAVPGKIETPQILYGIMAEEHIRRIYQLDVAGKYEVLYKPDCILQSKEKPMMLYSPDGLLREVDSGRLGLLEIKTTTIHGTSEKWRDQIPQNYYIQVLHGMAVTGAEFTELRALLRYSDDYEAMKTYHIDRSDVESEIEIVKDGIQKFWNYVETGEEPPLIIGGLK